MHYMPCTNGRGISPPCEVAHVGFFSTRKNHPTISSTANNKGNRIRAARTGRARKREDEGEGGREGEEEEQRLEGEGAILYYMPCANGHGISPPCGVAHVRFFSTTKNHPTLFSAANNKGNRIRAARTGRGRKREEELPPPPPRAYSTNPAHQSARAGVDRPSTPTRTPPPDHPDPHHPPPPPPRAYSTSPAHQSARAGVDRPSTPPPIQLTRVQELV